MTKELELKWELEPISKQTIDIIFVQEGLIHISTIEDPDKYTVVDCKEEYFAWWIENKSEEDDFIKDYDYDHEDGRTSKSKILDPEIDVFNVKDFSEFVRDTSGKYWIKESVLEIELNKLIQDLSNFKSINKFNAPSDVRNKINGVLLACRNIGYL